MRKHNKLSLGKVKEIIGNRDFILHPYKEDGKLCGYEIESFTNGGVDMIEFIDCREQGMNALNPKDIICEIERIARDFDVDEEIDVYRQDSRYREAFTCRQSVEDFEEYEKSLNELARELNKYMEEQYE